MLIHKLREYWITIAGIVLVLAIGLCFIICPQAENRWHGLMEAIFIAAFLTVTVDPFVKKRLLKEASQDIFHHLIGVDLPLEMRERLKKYVFGLRYYRTKLDVHVRQQREDSGRLRLYIKIEAHVIALTNCEYIQSLAFEKSENPRVLQMKAWNPRRTSEWSPAISRLIETPEEPMELLAKNEPIRLRRGEELDSVFSFNIHGDDMDFWVLNFGTTTLKTTVNLEPLQNMDMFVSDHDARDPDNPNVYRYDDVFIVGDHLHVRWRPKTVGRIQSSVSGAGLGHDDI